MYKYQYIYVYFEGLDKNGVMLTPLALTHMVGATRCWPNVSNNAAWPAVSPEIGPQFPGHGAGNRARKTPPPKIGAQFGPRVGGIEPATLRLQACVCLQLCQIRVASTAIHLRLLHAHRHRSRSDQIQNPKSKLQAGRLDFGFRILDLGVRILDLGFWI